MKWDDFNPFPDRKTREMLLLAKKEILTSRKLLEIEFGEFPLKGANIENTNDRPVEIHNMMDMKREPWWLKLFGSLLALGYVSDKKKSPEELAREDTKDENKGEYDRKIYINRALRSPLGRLFQLATVFHRPGYKIIGHEHIHVLQVNDENKTGVDMLHRRTIDEYAKSSLPIVRISHKFNNVVSLGVAKYLTSDIEIQARLHTLIATGYRERWHELPQTQHQLWGALISSGLIAPGSIYKELSESQDPGLKLFYDATKDPILHGLTKINGDSVELNMAYLTTNDPLIKEKYWRQMLPDLYGHLLELYGDPQGRSRLSALSATEPTKTQTSSVTAAVSGGMGGR